MDQKQIILGQVATKCAFRQGALGKLLDELNVLAGDGVKVVVTVSADMDVLPESVKKYA